MSLHPLNTQQGKIPKEDSEDLPHSTTLLTGSLCPFRYSTNKGAMKSPEAFHALSEKTGNTDARDLLQVSACPQKDALKSVQTLSR